MLLDCCSVLFFVVLLSGLQGEPCLVCAIKGGSVTQPEGRGGDGGEGGGRRYPNNRSSHAEWSQKRTFVCCHRCHDIMPLGASACSVKRVFRIRGGTVDRKRGSERGRRRQQIKPQAIKYMSYHTYNRINVLLLIIVRTICFSFVFVFCLFLLPLAASENIYTRGGIFFSRVSHGPGFGCAVPVAGRGKGCTRGQFGEREAFLIYRVFERYALFFFFVL